MDLNMKILVVDDFAYKRRIVRNFLNQSGFNNIVEAEDGKEALEELKKDDIGLIVSDWDMPVMKGVDLLKAVRGDEALKGILFMLMADEDHKEIVLEAVRFGVNNYIFEPFTMETFSIALEKALNCHFDN